MAALRAATPKAALYYGKNVKGLLPGGCTGGGLVGTVGLWLGGVRHTAKFGRVRGVGPHGWILRVAGVVVGRCR